MSMETPRDLFLHELSDTYSAEQVILEMIPKLVDEAEDRDLQAALKQHEKETRQQIKNLDQAFKLLGEQPEEMTCFGAEGLKKEHDSFVKEKPSAEVMTLFIAGAAGKTEHYEIESYTGLATSFSPIRMSPSSCRRISSRRRRWRKKSSNSRRDSASSSFRQ
jgi:ferritin-like metal-binding protein YciE